MKRSELLDSLSIAAPCDVPWSTMRGNDWVRSCGQCRKNVYNLASLTRDEALDVIARTEGSICLQLSRRLDGTIATADCWDRLRRARRRGLLVFLGVLPVVLAAQLWTKALGLGLLLSFFRRPQPAAVQAPPPPVPPPSVAVIVTAGTPPIHKLDQIRDELRKRHPRPPKRSR